MTDIYGGVISSDLERACAQEPIHLLGTVQSYGFTMVVELATERIVQVSSGVLRHWPGLQDLSAMIGAPLSDWVAPSDPGDRLDPGRLSSDYPVSVAWRARFEQTGGTADAAVAGWECLAHRNGEHAAIEWLPVPPNSRNLQHKEKILGEFGTMISRLRLAEALDSIYTESAKVIQEFTGFDRVMVYRFLPDGAGEVVAEHTSAACAPKYLGLRFPAADIPAQARALYMLNKLRLLADVDAPIDTLVPATLASGQPFDQSFCLLRAFSPVHLIYLRNMGVCASMSMSIICDGKLWGLIACHHQNPLTLSGEVFDGMRQVCELVAEIANMRIEALGHLDAVRQRFTLDRLINQVHQELMHHDDIAAVMNAWLPKLLPAFNASGIGLQIGSFNYVGGSACQRGSEHQVLDELRKLVDEHSRTPRLLMRTDLLREQPGILTLLPDTAGLLLAQRFDDGAIIFCCLTRPEVVTQVQWAGRPAKDMATLPDGQVVLQPRRSFELWQQSVYGQAEPWLQMEGESLQDLLRVVNEVHKVQINRKLHETMHWQAHHDHLTGLFNRRAMEDQVGRRLEQGTFDTALMLLDLDHFKKINDTYGHETGDLVLQELSMRLKSVMREFDLLARLGGDEFLVMLQIDHPTKLSALKLAKRLHRAVAKTMKINEQTFRLGISIGIAIPPGHGRSVSKLLRHADLALYQAKSLGRGRSAVFQPSMASIQREDYLLERDLNEAVERSELTLAFQPKLEMISRKVVGLEALVRWRRADGADVEPAAFIPIAERSDQITKIDRWVIRNVIETQARWRAGGHAVLPIAINLSVVDIVSPNLVEFVTGLLHDNQVPADCLEIEVTESCFIRQLGETRTVLHALNDSGIATTLDDFGTGFSSLSYLRQLPLQCLKIDQSFVATMLHDANAEKLTQAIVGMGQALHMKVVAEGVESVEQMEWLVAHGCRVGQGFLFSTPVPAENIHAVIAGIEQHWAA